MASQLVLPVCWRLQLDLAVADTAPPLNEIDGEAVVPDLGAVDGLDDIAYTNAREVATVALDDLHYGAPALGRVGDRQARWPDKADVPRPVQFIVFVTG